MGVLDRVCGMTIEPESAAATTDHDGATYYFCSEGCRRAFDEDPDRYLHSDHGDSSAHDHDSGGAHHHH